MNFWFVVVMLAIWIFCIFLLGCFFNSYASRQKKIEPIKGTFSPVTIKTEKNETEKNETEKNETEKNETKTIVIASSEEKQTILGQLFDQWKIREEHLWANIYKLFYAVLLLLFLPFVARFLTEATDKAGYEQVVGRLFNTNVGICYVGIGLILTVLYLIVGALYMIRLRTAKMTYDLTLKNEFGFNRVTASDLESEEESNDKSNWNVSFFNLPVNPMIIFTQFSILYFEIWLVFWACFCS